MNSAMSTKRKITDPLSPSKKLAVISAAKAARELIDTILLKLNTINHTARTIKKRIGNDPHRTPAPAAMPFPPLKPRKGVNTCPAIAPVPIQRPASLAVRLFCGKRSGKKITGHRLLTKSIIKTRAPIFLPRTRTALVAPTLPLPCNRISMPLKNRPARYAVGKEPDKNAASQKRINR